MLNFTKYGDHGQEIIILHGLFGSSKNWAGVASDLKDNFQVYVLDQRNHGDSPHYPTHTLDDLVADLSLFVDENHLQKPFILGHSMGGMCAMSFALKFPKIISGLLVVDIAPKQYESHHQKEFEMLNLDVSIFQTRKEIDVAMAKISSSKEVRQFLQMNLVKDGTAFRWKINTQVLEKAGLVEKATFNGTYTGPTLFIIGEDSPYVKKKDYKSIYDHFPDSQVSTIKSAGHWLHHSHQEYFLDELRAFLK